ncbi:hypothetical protein PIB30_056141 [Stylosanthes scabra]|uniref:Uncharacterized protein n=1 Tax=Stylosanthes scabra TaxID=79078 RepID=A0ABU6UI18_9FABA|nr:hypothetical protein [Stylosanthes scabra]
MFDDKTGPLQKNKTLSETGDRNSPGLGIRPDSNSDSLGGAGPASNGILGQEFTRRSVIYTESKLFEQEKPFPSFFTKLCCWKKLEETPLTSKKKLQVLDDPKLR